MKYYLKTFIASFLILFAVVLSNNAFADTPPPPPSGGHGAGGNAPPGGGAPIGEGILILVALGSVYAVKKWNSLARSME